MPASTVNPAYWGTPDQWVVTGTDPYPLADVKIGISGKRNYRALWEAGDMPFNFIDLSPYFYGISKKSLFNKVYMIAPYIRDSVNKVAVMPVNDRSEDKALLFLRSTTANTQNGFNFRYLPGRSTNVPTNASAYNGNVCLDFNYQKIVVEPWVLTQQANSTSSSMNKFTLYDYIENARYTTYPRIIDIGYRMYCGTTTRQAAPGLNPVIDYQIQDRALVYENKQFFAFGGFRTLQNGVTVDSQTRVMLRNTVFQNVAINNTVADETTALAYKYCVANEDVEIKLYLYDPDFEHYKINIYNTISGTDYWRVYTYIETTSENADEVKEYILKQMAYLGLQFLYDPANHNKQIGETGIYLPEFDENGVTTGNYFDGNQALAMPNAQWTNSRNAGYDPNKKDDGDTGDRDNSAYRGIYATGSNRFFALNQSELISFINFVNNMYVSDPDPDAAETQLKIDYKGSNPNDYIVSIFAVPKALNYLATPEHIYLGPVETTVSANRIEVQSEGAFSFGYYDIPAYYGDFRDYEPYTQIELYIPLCGTVKLDPAEYIGHRVVVDAIWDIQTGELTARVLRDGITITHTVQGSIAVQVPICARDMGSYQNNLHQIRMSLISAGLSSLSSTKSQAFSDINSVAQIASTKAGKTPHVGNITSGINPLNVAENAANTALSVYDNMYTLRHMQPQLYITGSASSANAINMERKAFIFIKRCKMLANYNASEYSHIIGNACCISGNISSFTGFTVAATANLDAIQTKSQLAPLPATEEEKQMIKKLLQTGVYI